MRTILATTLLVASTATASAAVGADAASAGLREPPAASAARDDNGPHSAPDARALLAPYLALHPRCRICPGGLASRFPAEEGAGWEIDP